MKQYFPLLLLAISSCNISNRSYSDVAKWVPSGFDQSKYILLVEKYPGKEKWNNAMKEFLDKHYSGKYEITDEKNILSTESKYADKKYKYAVMWKVLDGLSNSNRTTFTPATTTTTYYSDPKYDINGYFRDRASGTDYPQTQKYNNYGWQGFVPFFNSVIKYSK
ncbi:MAG TPA: hypothetical protein VFI29_04375 [Hanamia sp.]|nr:hypothetical protein [Hanamia sp.]